MLTLLALVAVLAGTLRFADQGTHDMLDKSLLQASGSFAVARVLDASISVVKSTQVSVGVASIELGEVLNPLSDLVDKFSWVMTFAVGSLALQKILLVITSSTIANGLLAAVAVAFIAGLWWNRLAEFRPFLFAAFKVTLLIRFAVILTVALSLLMSQLFLNQQIEESSQQVESLSLSVKELSEPETTEVPQQERSAWDTLKHKLDKVTGTVSAHLEKFGEIKEELDRSVLNFMNLMILFLLKTVLMPLGFLWWLKRFVF